MRLIKTVEVDLDEATAHLWMRIPALRSIDQERPAEQNLTQANAAELLVVLVIDASTTAAQIRSTSDHAIDTTK